MTTAYAIRGGEEGARRLELLAQVVGPGTDSLLGGAGITAGMTCLERDAVAMAELAAFTDDPRSTIACPRIFQVRGRKPGRDLRS